MDYVSISQWTCVYQQPKYSFWVPTVDIEERSTRASYSPFVPLVTRDQISKLKIKTQDYIVKTNHICNICIQYAKCIRFLDRLSWINVESSRALFTVDVRGTVNLYF